MPGITLAAIQPLLDQFKGEGIVLSCYADLGIRDGFRPNWEGPFKAQSDVLWKAIGEDGRARRELEANLAAVKKGLESDATNGARWAAIFSAAERGFFKVIPLDVPVQNDLVLDRSPYLVPLLASMHRRRAYLAVHTNTSRGRIYLATPGSVRLLVEVEGDVPKRQHSSGERLGGFEPAGIDRHRDDRIMQYRKELVRELEKAWDAGPRAGLILLGEHEIVAQLRGELPQRMTGRVLREVAQPWQDEQAQAIEKIRSLATELFNEHEAEVAPGFWDLLREGKVVVGPQKVLSALQGGQLGRDGHGYLVVGPDPREVVGLCVACRTLATDPVGSCPRCQAPCTPGSLWEEMLLTALRHGITARFVADGRKLDPYGGAVVVMPRPDQVRKEKSA